MIMPLYLITYAIRSETATAVVVEAEDVGDAKSRAIRMEYDRDPFWGPYALSRSTSPMLVQPVCDGLVVNIDAPR